MTLTGDGFYNWESMTGAASTPDTGASGDHTSGSGKYLSTDADMALGQSKGAIATTPKITIMEVKTFTNKNIFHNVPYEFLAICS